MLHSPLAQITTLLMTAITAWSLGVGRWPEKIGAGAIAFDWAGSVVFQDRHPGHHGQPVIFALDVCMFVVLLGLVLNSRRTWVLWATACSLLLVLTHISEMLDVSVRQWAYLTVSYVWSISLLVALAVGVALEGGEPAEVCLSFADFRGRRLSTPSAKAQSRN